MATQIFVNLPVRDLAASQAFYRALGFGIDPQFTDDNAACVVLGDTVYAMLLTHDFFRRFTRKELADAQTTTEVINALGVGSRARVDEIADRALASGGSATSDPQDEGWMYSRAFADPDGHQWEVMHMDTAAAQEIDEG